MNLEDAKLILQACRPGDEASADPQLAEALALAKKDPALTEWFAREQLWDARVRRELQTVPVPVDLKAQILALRTVVPLPVRAPRKGLWARHSPVAWAMAAAVVIFIGFAFAWSHHQPTENLAEFAHDMIAASPLDAHHVDVENSNFDQVKGWLAERHAIANIDLPPAIKNAPGLMGCRMMDWQGHEVSMLCFVMNGSQHVDLFVTPASGVAGAPESGKPQFVMVDQQNTAGWTEGGNLYLLTGKVPESFLRHCVEAPATARKGRPVVFAWSVFH